MDYTQSNSFVVDAGTGFNRHEDNAAVPTALTEKDLNSLIWSLMEVVKAGGQVGAQFDEAVPATYKVLLKALKAAFGGNVTTVNFAASPFALTVDHAGMVLVDATAGNVVINLPAANVLAGLTYEFRRVDTTANTVTVNRAGANTIDEGGTSFTMSIKSVRQVRSNGVSTWSTTAGRPAATEQDMSASRSSGFTYYNTGNGDIEVSNQVTSNVGAVNSVILYIDGHQVASTYMPGFPSTQTALTVFGVVRPGESYSSVFSGAAGVWTERR